MQEQPTDPRDWELMQTLGTLKLSPPGASQRDIWYRAGVKTGRRHARTWKALAAIMTLSAGLAFAWDRRMSSPPPVVYMQHAEHPAMVEPSPTAMASASASIAYEQMRERLIEQGLNGLPPIDFSGGSGQSPSPPQRHSDDREDAPPLFWYR